MPDLIQRDFSVGEPGRRTCGDITYIPTGECWLFLAGVLDLGSRRCRPSNCLVRDRPSTVAALKEIKEEACRLCQ